MSCIKNCVVTYSEVSKWLRDALKYVEYIFFRNILYFVFELKYANLSSLVAFVRCGKTRYDHRSAAPREPAAQFVCPWDQDDQDNQDYQDDQDDQDDQDYQDNQDDQDDQDDRDNGDVKPVGFSMTGRTFRTPSSTCTVYTTCPSAQSRKPRKYNSHLRKCCVWSKMSKSLNINFRRLFHNSLANHTFLLHSIIS